MKQGLLAAFLIFGLSNFAFAENFLCDGTGKFSAISYEKVHLDWKTTPQFVLTEADGLKVQISLEKSSSDRLHYYSINVFETSKHGKLRIRTATGSISDMVRYGDTGDIVACVPSAAAHLLNENIGSK